MPTPNLFNSNYSNYYQQTYSQQPYTYQSQPQQNHNSTSVVWVQGIAGAQAYPVAAGNTVMLMDSEDSVFYMKSTDNTGRPLPLRVFEFKERTNEPQQEQKVDLTNYVTWDAFEKRMDELEAKRKENTRNVKSNKKPNEQLF